MKTLILSASNSRNSGGIFNSARSLGMNLNKYCNIDTHFLMHDDEYSHEDRKYYEPFPLHTYSIKGPTNFCYSSDIYGKIVGIKPDIIHVQCIWLYLSVINNYFHKKHGTPYMVSTRGMLDPWQLEQSKLKKKIALFLYERRHLERASAINALCLSEYESIRKIDIKTPVAIIPNGVTLPDSYHKQISNDNGNTTVRDKRKTLLFLSRLHHKKGIENMIKAWALTNPKQQGWVLKIAGETKDEAYYRHIVDLSRKLKVEESIQFIGGQFGKNKHNTFVEADAFILPSFSEGLPMAVLEAWSYKLPAILTDYCNLPEGFESKAAIRIETNIDSIAEGIKKLLSMSNFEREIMGVNGYELVKSSFTWEHVARMTQGVYNWILEGGEKPTYVRY